MNRIKQILHLIEKSNQYFFFKINPTTFAMMGRSIFYSIAFLKCPKCRKGDLYTPLKIKKPLDMFDNCPICAQKFTLEPGFYWGAMFISYIITAFALFAMLGALIIGFEWGVSSAMFLGVFVLFMFYLYIVRISRSVWIHFFVKYDPSKDLISR